LCTPCTTGAGYQHYTNTERPIQNVKLETFLVGAQDLLPADADKLGLQGLTETWKFDVRHLKDIANSIWETVTKNKWKVVETGISFDDIFPYDSLSGM